MDLGEANVNFCLNYFDDDYQGLMNLATANKSFYQACKGLLPYKREIYNALKRGEEYKIIQLYNRPPPSSPEDNYYFQLIRNHIFQTYFRKFMTRDQVRDLLENFRYRLTRLYRKVDFLPITDETIDEFVSNFGFYFLMNNGDVYVFYKVEPFSYFDFSYDKGDLRYLFVDRQSDLSNNVSTGIQVDSLKLLTNLLKDFFQ